MIRFKIKFTQKVLAFAIALPSTLFAQTNNLNISLHDAVDLAVKSSYELEIAKNNVESNTLLNYYGVAGGLPTVTANLANTEQLTNLKQNLSNGTEINKRGTTGNNTQANVNAGILIYNGKRVVAAKKRLEFQQDQSTEDLNSQLQNTIAQVATSYYDVVRQRSYINTIKTSIYASEKRLEILTVRQEAGLANNADTFQAQIDLNTLKQTLMEQEMVENIAKTQLKFLLAIEENANIMVTDTVINLQDIELQPILEGLKQNSDYKAAEYQIRIQEMLVRETNAQRYPSIRFNMAYNYSRNQSTAGFNLLNQSIGPNANVTVTVPIYNGSVFRRQKEVAEINTKNARLQRDIILRDYSSNVVSMYERYKSSLQQIEIQKKNYDLSKLLLNLTLERFSLIQATIIDVREAQKSFEDSGYRLVNLNFAAKAAEIELNRLTNTLAY